MVDTLLETDVVIVGGGLAGLTCGVGLCNSGLRVTVLEQEAILGGRARSWVDAKTGNPISIGPHIFLNHYPNMFRLLELCGTLDRVVWQKNGQFINLVEGAHLTTIKSCPLPPPYHFVPSLLNDPRISLGDLISNWPLVQMAAELTEQGVCYLDNLSALELLKAAGVTSRFINQFWAFTSIALLNVPLELCSAGALIRLYRHVLIGHGDMRIGFADRGLGDIYAPQARALIEKAGGPVFTGTRVKRFVGSPTHVEGVELADGRCIKAQFCVAAVPPQALYQLALPEWIEEHAPFQNLIRFEPVPYISPYLWFDDKLTDLPFWARVYAPEDLNCDFYDLSNIYPGWEHRPSVITSNIIYSYRAERLSDKEIVEHTRQELSEFLPEARSARLIHAVVNRIPMAIHAPHPGTETLRPDIQTPVERLFVAGDWTRTHFPSSMESAVRSGWLAAEHILSSIGNTQKLAQEPQEPKGLIPFLHQLDRWFPLGKGPFWLHQMARGKGPKQ